jgi:hypothetical protein
VNNIWYLAGLAASCLICTFAAYWRGWSNGRRTTAEQTFLQIRNLEELLEDAYEENNEMWDELEMSRDEAKARTKNPAAFRLNRFEQAIFHDIIRETRRRNDR